jgi:hypothetical protein
VHRDLAIARPDAQPEASGETPITQAAPPCSQGPMPCCFMPTHRIVGYGGQCGSYPHATMSANGQADPCRSGIIHSPEASSSRNPDRGLRNLLRRDNPDGALLCSGRSTKVTEVCVQRKTLVSHCRHRSMGTVAGDMCTPANLMRRRARAVVTVSRTCPPGREVAIKAGSTTWISISSSCSMQWVKKPQTHPFDNDIRNDSSSVGSRLTRGVTAHSTVV